MFTSFDLGPFAFYSDRAVTLAFLSLPFRLKVGVSRHKTRIYSSALNGFVERPWFGLKVVLWRKEA